MFTGSLSDFLSLLLCVIKVLLQLGKNSILPCWNFLKIHIKKRIHFRGCAFGWLYAIYAIAY